MVNPRFIEIKQERPLDFVEQPVTNGETVALRAGTAFEVMCHYFIKTLAPYPMAYYYGYRYIKPEPITDPKPLAGLIIYLLLIVLAVALMHKNALLSMGLIIYLVSLTIFSGYFYPVPGQVADRFMLIPSIGWSILLGVAVFGTVKITSRSVVNQWRSVKNIVKAAFLALLLVYSAVTFARNFNWADDLTLFRHDISTVDESVQAHNILATHLIDHSLVANDPSEQKQLREEAIKNFKKAADIRPSFFNATYDLGRVYLLLNMPDSALAWFIKANKINADFIEVQFYIADIYTQLGQYQAAIPYLEYTIRARPGDYAAYNKLSYVYFRLNDAYRSIEVSKQAILKTQAGGLPYAAIGSVYLSLNKPDSAGLWAHKALEIEPGNRGATQLLQRIGTR
jgi:tetratricopeptide (TPR) repeat protein